MMKGFGPVHAGVLSLGAACTETSEEADAASRCDTTRDLVLHKHMLRDALSKRTLSCGSGTIVQSTRRSSRSVSVSGVQA